MKKLLLNLAIVFAVPTAMGAGYQVDFNSPFDTSDPAFKVAPGWKHLVSTGSYAAQKVTYTYQETLGMEGSGCLQAGAQSYYDIWDGKDIELNDLLVSPLVSGNVTLQVKWASPTTNGSVKFYKVTEANGTLVKGEEIAYDDTGIVSMFYTQITLPAISEATMIGIRCENALIDDFYADNAEVSLSKELQISNVTSSVTGKTDCDADNKFMIAGSVRFKNSGDVDIEKETSNFSLALMKPDASGKMVVDKTLGTFPITEDIPYGKESGDIQFSIMVNESDIDALEGSADKSRRYDIVADLANDSKVLANITPIPYKPIPSYSTAKVSDLENDGTIDMGIVTGSGNVVLKVTNDGAKEMLINKVDVTGEGFSVDPAANISIPKHESKELVITLSSDQYGEKTGKITLTSEDLPSISFNLTGNVLDPASWYVDFEDGEIPGNMLSTSGWQVSNKLAIDPNKYYAINENTQNPGMLISPLLSAGQGEKLTFEAARSYGDSNLKVYTSSDRKNWTLIRELSSDAENAQDRFSDEYSGLAWGSNTKYVFTTFELTNLPSEPFYIAFETGNARIDNILGGKVQNVDHDVYFLNVESPVAGMVNRKVNVAFTLKNLSGEEKSQDYTLTLKSGDETLAEAENVDIAAYGSHDFAMEFTPHQPGEMNLHLSFETDGQVFESEPFVINISEEMATGSVQVGEITETNTSKTSPVNLFNYKSQSETVYTADLLGLKPGTKITQLVFRANSTGDKTIDINLQVWIENTKDSQPASVLLEEGYTDGMDLIYDGNYNVKVSKAFTDLIVIDLATPFEYTGDNLRVVMNHSSSSFVTTYFELDKNVSGQSLYRSHDTKLPASFSSCSLPVMHLLTSREPDVLKGIVTDEKGFYVPNAKITLTSGDVLYQGVSGTEGEYSINVYQSDLTFLMKVEADGYQTFETDLTIDDPETEKDVTLQADKTVEIEGLKDVPADGAIYDINGLPLKEKPQKGLYIQNGKVFIAK